MNLIDLIKKECPNGVKYKKLWEVTIWDKKFQDVDNSKQEVVEKYKYFYAKDLDKMIQDNGDIKILTTYESNLFTSKQFVSDQDIKNLEVVSIPGGCSYAKVQYFKGKFITSDNRICFSKDTNILNNRFLYFYLKNKENLINTFYRGESIQHPIMSSILEIDVPLPPIKIQERIANILDLFTKYEAELEAELDKRDKQYSYYLNYLLDFDNPKVIDKLLNYSKIEYKSIGDVTEYIQPTKYIVNKTDYSDDSKTPVLTPGKTFILGYTNEETGIFPGKLNPVILFDDFTTDFKWVDFDFKVKSSASKIIHSADENKFLIKYIYFYMKTIESKNFQEVVGTIKRQWISEYSNKKIPIPSIDIQHKIVNLLDNFETMCKDLKIGLPAELSKRQKQYEFYRDYIFAVLTNNEELVDNLSHTHTHTF